MTEKNQALLNRWLQGDDVDAEVSGASLDPETRVEWEAQSTMDALLRMQEGDLKLSTGFHDTLMTKARELGRSGSGRGLKRRPLLMRYLGIAAAAACVLFSFGFWMLLNIRSPGPGRAPRTVTVAPGWSCTFSEAQFTTPVPGIVRLERGEVSVQSVPMDGTGLPRQPITVETPNAKATASDATFNVAVQREETEQGTQITTRVSIGAGQAMLTNGRGMVSGETNDRLVAEGDKAPIRSP